LGREKRKKEKGKVTSRRKKGDYARALLKHVKGGQVLFPIKPERKKKKVELGEEGKKKFLTSFSLAGEEGGEKGAVLYQCSDPARKKRKKESKQQRKEEKKPGHPLPLHENRGKKRSGLSLLIFKRKKERKKKEKG